MKRIGAAFCMSLCLVVLGCVITTKHQIDAHIVLDIRHIQQQADQVLDYIEGKTDTIATPPASPAATSSLSEPTLFDRICYAISPVTPAYAAEMKESSPKVKEYADSMRKRQPEVEALKKQGAIGEDNRGYVALREGAAVADAAKKNAAQQLIAAENADRKGLYREVARDNADQNLSLTAVERVYAQRRLMRGEAGEIFQLPAAGEDFEKFKASTAGKNLGAACKPEAWVTLK